MLLNSELTSLAMKSSDEFVLMGYMGLNTFLTIRKLGMMLGWPFKDINTAPTSWYG